MKWINRLVKWLGFGTKKNNHRKHWTKAEEFTLRNLELSKYTDSEMAKKLGRTKRAIQQKRYTRLR